MLSANTTDTLPNGDPTAGNHYYDFDPTISIEIGYTSSLISVGVGYNATIGNKWREVHGKNHRQAAHTPDGRRCFLLK